MVGPELNLKREGRKWGFAPGTQERIRGARPCQAQPCASRTPTGGQHAQDRPRPGASTGVPAGTKQGRWVQTLEGMPRGDRQLGGEGTLHQFRAGTPIKGSRIRNLGTPEPTSCPSLLPLPPPESKPHPRGLP